VAAHQATDPLDGPRGPDFRVTSFDGMTSNFAEDRARRSIVLEVKLVSRGVRIPRVFVHSFRLFSYSDSGVFVHPGGG
jgi:hypothetical protein